MRTPTVDGYGEEHVTMHPRRGGLGMIRRSAWLGLLAAAALLLLSTFPSPALAWTVSFAAPHAYSVGVGPWAVATGDFTGGSGPGPVVGHLCAHNHPVVPANGGWPVW